VRCLLIEKVFFIDDVANIEALGVTQEKAIFILLSMFPDFGM
jgi:hypothetical protein